MILEQIETAMAEVDRLMTIADKNYGRGAYTDTLTCIDQVLRLTQMLVAVDRTHFLPFHAICLNKQAACLRDMGEFDRSKPHLEACTDIWRELRRVAPHDATIRQGLANTELGWFELCCHLGQDEQAIPHVSNAVAIYRHLAEEEPIYQPNLAWMLMRQARHVAALDNLSEALIMGDEAHALIGVHGQQLPQLYLEIAGDYVALLKQAQVWQDAINILDHCIVLIRQTSDKEDGESLWTLTKLALEVSQLHALLGHWDAAIQAAKDSVFIRRCVLQELSEVMPSLSESLDHYGEVLRQCGRWDEALAAFKESVAMRLNWANQSEQYDEGRLLALARSQMLLALLLSDMGNVEEALALAQVGLDYPRSNIQSRNHQQERVRALLQHDMALIAENAGQLQLAIDAVKQALDWYRSLRQEHGFTKREIARSLNTLGKFYFAHGQIDEALNAYDEAYSRWHQLAGDHPGLDRRRLAIALNGLTICHRRLGNTGEALETGKEELRHWRHLANDNPAIHLPDLLISLLNSSSFLSSLGNYKGALRFARESVDRLKLYASHHDHWQQGQGLRIAIELHFNLACRLREQESDRETCFRDASDALQSAIELAESLRCGWIAADQRKRILTEMQSLYQTTVQHGIDSAGQLGDPCELAVAVIAAEKSRARTLTDMFLAENRPQCVDDNDWERYTQLQRMRMVDLSSGEWSLCSSSQMRTPHAHRHAAMRFTFDELDIEGNPGEARAEPIPADASSLAAELGQLSARFQAQNPTWNPSVLPDINIEALTSLIGPHELFIQFHLIENQGAAFILSHDGKINHVPLSGLGSRQAWQFCEAWIDQYYGSRRIQAMEHRNRAREREAEQRVAAECTKADHLFKLWFEEDWTGALPGLLQTISEEIIHPVWDMLDKLKLVADLKRIVFSLHGPYHQYPLAACHLPNGQHLGDAVELVSVPSFSLLHLLKQRIGSGEPDCGLIIGDPTEDLRFAELETHSIQAHTAQCMAITGIDACRGAVAESSSQATFFHFSGHAFYNPEHPLDSGLRLADATLTTRDIFRERRFPRCDLAFINGCESGMLTPNCADEYVSIPTAMLFAGARCVISTLWPIHDISAALASIKFHALWNGGDGVNPARALHQMQCWLRGDQSEGIQTGVQLRDEILPSLIHDTTDDALALWCREAGDDYARRFPSSPPFASPVHWAAYVLHGCP